MRYHVGQQVLVYAEVVGHNAEGLPNVRIGTSWGATYSTMPVEQYDPFGRPQGIAGVNPSYEIPTPSN